MNNQSQIIEWGSHFLISKGHNLEGSPVFVLETPWSKVLRFVTSQGDFYLKQTPSDLFIEPQVIQAIQKNDPESPIPEILCQNNELKCFLMTSCGNHSLRTKFNGTIEKELLIKGIQSYIYILRSFEKNQDALKKIGVPDWRINQIPDHYVELLENKEMLIDEGLTQDELDELIRLIPAIKSICDSLSEQVINETLVNSDFNENNIILNETTQQMSIIDWGESVISHPFFSIASHLRANARRYQLPLNGPFLENIRQRCLSCWSDVANMDELELIYQRTLQLQPIFSALAIYRLQVATLNKSKAQQTWFIGTFLKALLQKTMI